ncbi:hypothetical protein [Cystobacter fuscus]|uniref:hypothetical protein n=1 Tax=Cystobacter fuscus TaxID=43 RepID=UPI002B2EBDB3|nr:hypothetical protein F0U63_28175 [Cystobacter fuscus]
MPVFYRPEAPEDAALLRGLEGADLLFLLFVATLTLLGFLGMYALVYFSRAQAAQVAEFVVDGRTHVTLNALSPMVTGWCVMAGVALVLYPLLGLATQFHPSLRTAGLAWGFVLTCGVLVTWWTQARMVSGEWDLILDECNRRLSLPPMKNQNGAFERPARVELDWTRVQAVTLERHTRKDDKGDTSTHYRPTVTFLDARGEVQREPIAEWSLEGRASALVLWLQSRLANSTPGREP